MNGSNNLSVYNVVHAITLALACLISYWFMMNLLNPVVARDDDLLGGMWAAVASAFVFRDTSQASLSAGVARLIATLVSISLCLGLAPRALMDVNCQASSQSSHTITDFQDGALAGVAHYHDARLSGKTESDRTPCAPWMRTPSMSAVAEGPVWKLV